MNRRQLVLLSGAAAASQGFAQTAKPSGDSQRAAYKTLLKLSHPKSSYKVPKTEAKKNKYLDSLTAALNLTPDQRQQLETSFTNAMAARGALHSSLKTARQNLRAAVTAANSAAIDQLSQTVGTIRAQLISIGAQANVSLYRLLTPDQQSKLSQFRS